jgi:hypothetical protein
MELLEVIGGLVFFFLLMMALARSGVVIGHKGIPVCEQDHMGYHCEDY